MRSLVMTIFVCVIWTLVGYNWGKMEGVAEGRSQALSTNPVSEELEMICAGLWVGEQNKKYKDK